MKNRKGGAQLETIISYVLIVGVIASLLLTVTGLVIYRFHGNSTVLLDDPSLYIKGQNFFTFIGSLFTEHQPGPAIFFLAVGITILILTPFIRVVASVGFFATHRDMKYVVITLFVLVALTISLLLH